MEKFISNALGVLLVILLTFIILFFGTLLIDLWWGLPI
jgi:hypothetical protein